jgi:3-isopropylmalate/(R)-2-methylmalate dehydratase small subunit
MMPAGTIDRIEGTAVAVRGDDIDTDRIIPARFLKAVTFDGLEDHAFADDRALAARRGERHPFDDPASETASLLVVNRNFGCGSSREHAPRALLRRGFRAIVGESFSEIFFANAVALGLPCFGASAADVASLMDLVERNAATHVAVSVAALTIDAGGHGFAATMPPGAREALVTGAWDGTHLLLERYEDVEAVAARLPYLQGFTGPVCPG